MEKFMQRWPLYVRIGWALVVVFGMVGEFTGHKTGAMLVVVILTIVWTCTRILSEAFVSYRRLREAWAQDDAERERNRKPDKRDDEPPFPPAQPPTAVA